MGTLTVFLCLTFAVLLLSAGEAWSLYCERGDGSVYVSSWCGANAIIANPEIARKKRQAEKWEAERRKQERIAREKRGQERIARAEREKERIAREKREHTKTAAARDVETESQFESDTLEASLERLKILVKKGVVSPEEARVWRRELLGLPVNKN